MCRVYTTRLIDHNAIFATAVDKRVFTVGNCLHAGAGCSQQPPLRPQTGKASFFFPLPKTAFILYFFSLWWLILLEFLHLRCPALN